MPRAGNFTLSTFLNLNITSFMNPTFTFRLLLLLRIALLGLCALASAEGGTGYAITGEVTVTTPFSNVSTLSSLTLSSGTLNPGFASSTTSYTASVANATSALTVTPTVTNSFATVRVNGALVNSGSNSQSIPLALGGNTITVVGTAEDGTSTSTYTLTVTRLRLTDSTLSTLYLSSGILSPGFASSTTSYTASVANATTSITVRPTLSTTTASVRVNGVLVNSGTNSQSIPLTVGNNTITILGTAEDGITTTSYNISVTRPPSAVSTLFALTLSSGTLSPGFASGTTSYATSVTNATTSITLKPTVTDATATIKVNGVSVNPGSNSQSIALAVGTNPITVLVTAQDGVTTSTYTLAVSRAPSSTSTLSNLLPSSGSLSPVFSSATPTYSVTVNGSTLAVTPTLTDSTATLKVNGTVVSSGSASAAIPLSIGSNTITAVVTAQDGVSKTTYTLTVTRLSTVSTLSGLALDSGPLSPAFSSGTLAYSARVDNTTTSVKVTPTSTEPYAAVTVNGSTVVSGSASSSIPLLAGPNTIQVVGTAQDGTSTTYTLTITRAFLDVVFTSATTGTIQASSYHATGNAVNLALTFAPPTGTNLTLVNQTGLGFIIGRYANLAQGQTITLSHNKVVYRFVVNYYGGTGNDLVLHWADNEVSAWGANNRGQLGDGTSNNSSLPQGVTNTGALSGKTILAISAGSSHSLALCSDGTVAAWGYNFYGQLGNSSTTDTSVPVRVDQSGVLGGKTVVSVAAGHSHSLALCSDGTLVSWGWNAYGQLGNDSTTSSSIPVSVIRTGELNGKVMTSMVAGYYHNLAYCADGTLVSWGRNNAGQLGNNNATDSKLPVNITSSGVLSGRGVSTLAAGGEHSLVLCQDGALVSWGKNANGQLGIGSTTNSLLPVEVDATDVLAGRSVLTISAGGFHNLAACTDGTLVAFGRNSNGQLGNNSTADATMPVAVNLSPALNGKTITGLRGANAHSLALCSDGSIASWGSGSNGLLGNGGTANSNVPVEVVTSSYGSGERFMTLATGASASHNMALVAAPPTNTGFSVWTASHAELSDSTALGDPDGDGIPNVLEYVLHGNPTVASAAVLPVVSQNASSFLFSFSRDVASAADTTQVFQYSTDLNHWTELSLTLPTDARVTLGAEDGAGIQPVTVMIPKQGDMSMFGRLKVVKP
jgi:alpha-tubulin suppressor-like RCC1 family protein